MKIKALTLFLLLSLVVGCGTTQNFQPSSSPAARQVTPMTTQTRNGNKIKGNQQPGATDLVTSAVRIVVFQDKSRSVNETRTVQLTEEDFNFLISLLRKTSGELAFGIVDDRSGRPLLRLRIDAPPARPTAPEASNAFERAELNAAYEEELSTYEARLKQWNAEIDERVKAFMDKLKPLLQLKAAAGKTNVYEAIARINLFAGESEASWPRPTHLYAVVNSDAIDTTHAKPVRITDRVKLILINGAGSTGVLESANPFRFESVQSALDFISASETGGNQ